MVTTHADYLDRLLELITQMNTIARVSFQTAGFKNPLKAESYNLNVYPLKLVRPYETYNFRWIITTQIYTISIKPYENFPVKLSCLKIK